MVSTEFTIGFPFGIRTPILALSLPTMNSIKFQSGSIFLINLNFINTGDQNIENLRVITRFNGNEDMSRFGKKIEFHDFDNDGFDDFFISEPLRNFANDNRRVDAGTLYYFNGKNFPVGVINNCQLSATKVFNHRNDRSRFSDNFIFFENSLFINSPFETIDVNVESEGVIYKISSLN